MALKPSSYLILGLVHDGVNSGYAMRQFIGQNRMSEFWATTFAQIYPELAQLEESGYLTHEENPRGARNRRAYSLTTRGEKALASWLRRTTVPPMELRDEGLLRLGFADQLSPAGAIALVRRLIRRAEESERQFREEIMPGAEALAALGRRFPLVIARMEPNITPGRSGISRRLKRSWSLSCQAIPSGAHERTGRTEVKAGSGTETPFRRITACAKER